MKNQTIKLEYFFLWNHKQYADLTCKIWFYGDNIRWLVDNRARESMKRLDFYLLYDIYHMWRKKICWLNQILRNKSTKKTYVFITFDIYIHVNNTWWSNCSGEIFLDDFVTNVYFGELPRLYFPKPLPSKWISTFWHFL